MKSFFILLSLILCVNVIKAQINPGIYTISDGEGCAINKGAIRIQKPLNGKFSFAIAVDGPETGQEWKMEGRLKGTATVISKTTAEFRKNGTKLIFSFNGKNLRIVEELDNPANAFHGAGICFDGTYKYSSN